MSNRTQGEKWKELVALVLHGFEVHDLTPKREFTSLSEFFQIAADAKEGRIQSSDFNTRNWAINASSSQALRVSESLDQVATTGAFDGRSRQAVISLRKGRHPSDALVLMTLKTFSAVLRDEGS